MQIFPYQAHVAQRMQAGGAEVSGDAVFCRTDNGYWIAWHDGTAAVLADDAPEGAPCDVVEGAHDLDDLAGLIESGDYAEAEEFEGSEEEWQALVAEMENEEHHGHSHDETHQHCACGSHGTHPDGAA